MLTRTATPTYLDRLPNELLNIIIDYVVAELDTPYATFADCVQSLHIAWPGSRYESFTEPYMHYVIDFEGLAIDLKRIMDKFLLRPETRLWARVLRFSPSMCLRENSESPFKSIEEEFAWMAEACTKLGLKVEDMKLPDISADISEDAYESEKAWLYQRVEFLAQVLHKLTTICYDTNSEWIWPFLGFYKKDPPVRVLLAGGLGSQSEDGESMPESIVTPVPPALRTVERYYIGHDTWSDKRPNPYQALLPAFCLPKICFIQSENINWPSAHEFLLHSVPCGSTVHTSPVTTLHLTRCNVPLEILERLLSLPKALFEFGYWNSGSVDRNTPYCIWDVGQLLLEYQSKSLEVLTLDGVEADENCENVLERYRYPRATWTYYPVLERIGSLRDFVKLRYIEVPYWNLVGGESNPWEIHEIAEVEEYTRCPELFQHTQPPLPYILPRSLETIKLSLQRYQTLWLPIENVRLFADCNIVRQLKSMIQKKKEMYPKLTKVELDIRFTTDRSGPVWKCLYKNFLACLGDLAREEKVQLIIN